MRVAYLCLDPGIPLLGSKGASNHVREVCAALEAEGHEVELFGARMGKGDERLPRTVHRVGMPCRAEASSRQREEHELGRNDALENALRLAHSRRPFDLIYERYSLWSFVANRLAEEWVVPYVVEVNSPLRREQVEHRRLTLDSAAAQVEEEVFRNSDLLVCVSPAVADYAALVRGQRTGVLTVPNGVDLNLFSGVPAAPRDDASLVIGFAGSLKPWHGIGTLLEAFAELTEEDDAYRLLIVGDGPERAGIESFLDARGLGARADLTGAVPKCAIPALLRRMDVATAPYERLEGFYFSPLKLFEYMAAGAAIVASRTGQIPEVLEHEQTGLLAEPGDARDLADHIRRIRHDRALGARLGEAARTAAFREHGWERRVRTILEAVESYTAAGVLR